MIRSLTLSCLLLPASFVLPLGISSSYARASSRSSSAGTSRLGQSRVDRTGRGVGRKQQTRATAGGDHGAPTSDEASRVDWRPLHENFGQRASIFALDGTQPIDLLWAAIAQIGAVNSRLIRQKLCFKIWGGGLEKARRGVYCTRSRAHRQPPGSPGRPKSGYFDGGPLA